MKKDKYGLTEEDYERQREETITRLIKKGHFGSHKITCRADAENLMHAARKHVVYCRLRNEEINNPPIAEIK